MERMRRRNGRGRSAISLFKRTFDRSIAEGEGAQFRFFLGVTLVILTVFVFVGQFCNITISATAADEASEFWSEAFSRARNVYYHFVDPGNQYMLDGWPSQLFAMLVSTFGTLLVSGFLISTLFNIMDRRVDKIRSGRVFYDFRGHTLIIGYDAMAASLVKQIARDSGGSKAPGGLPDIVIQSAQDIPAIRHDLMARIDDVTARRVIFVSGSRTSREDLERLDMGAARSIFVLGDREDSGHDALNMECVNIVADILRAEGRGAEAERCFCERRRLREELAAAREAGDTAASQRLGEELAAAEERYLESLKPGPDGEGRKSCTVHFEYQSTFAVFQREEVRPEIGYVIDFRPFNFYERWAEKVFVEGCYDNASDAPAAIRYLPLDRVPVTEHSNRKVHLVVAGMTRMGVAMGMEAVLLAHYPNFVTRGVKSRITFIDGNARQEMDFLRGRYRRFFDNVDMSYVDTEDPVKSFSRAGREFTDLEVEFVRGNIESDAVRNMLAEWSRDEDRLLTIAICFERPHESFAAGLYLPDEVYLRDDGTPRGIPVLIRQDVSSKSVEQLHGSVKYGTVRAFGMIDECYSMSRPSSVVARAINYCYDYWHRPENRGRFLERCYDPMSEELPRGFEGRTPEELWRGVSVELKWSNIYNANMLSTRERSLGWESLAALRETNEAEYRRIIDLGACVEHNRWVTEKLLMGFRPLAEADLKSGDAQRLKRDKIAHECICGSDRLPDELRANDLMIVANTGWLRSLAESARSGTE